MTITELLRLTLVFFAGAGLGLFFYGTLWWTVRRGLSSQRPELWFFCSWLLRMSIVVTGIIAVADHRWERLLVCVVGFLVARAIVTWRIRLPSEPRDRSARVSHAP